MSKFMRHLWIIYNQITGYFINHDIPRHPKYLIGKWAVRIKLMGHDYSFMTNPIKILKVTDNHIYCMPYFCEKEHILESCWIDENWVEYKPVMKEK